MRKRSWTKEDLINTVAVSKSKRQVLFELKLVPAGGNYEQIKKYLKIYNIDISHFTGSRWNVGMRGRYLPMVCTSDILKKDSDFQSFKLKRGYSLKK